MMSLCADTHKFYIKIKKMLPLSGSKETSFSVRDYIPSPKSVITNNVSATSYILIYQQLIFTIILNIRANLMGFTTLFYTTLLTFFGYDVVKSVVKKVHQITLNYTFLHLSSQNLIFFPIFISFHIGKTGVKQTLCETTMSLNYTFLDYFTQLIFTLFYTTVLPFLCMA